MMGVEYKTGWQVLVEDLSRILGAEIGWRNMEECAKRAVGWERRGRCKGHSDGGGENVDRGVITETE